MHSPTFPVDSNGLPLLERGHIEDVADALAGKHPKTLPHQPYAIDIDDLAQNQLGFHQDIVPLAHRFIFAGASILRDTEHFPVYNPAENVARYTMARKGTMLIDSRLLQDERQYRWAVAHQCGHLLLHQTLHLGCDADLPSLKEPWFRCYSVDGLHDEPGTLYAQVEQQASHLALALLMPRQVVHILSENVPESGTFSPHDEVKRMVEMFQVPVEVARRRLDMLRT